MLKEMKALASELSLKVKLDVEQHEDACGSMSWIAKAFWDMVKSMTKINAYGSWELWEWLNVEFLISYFLCFLNNMSEYLAAKTESTYLWW